VHFSDRKIVAVHSYALHSNADAVCLQNYDSLKIQNQKLSIAEYVLGNKMRTQYQNIEE
jgi:hypothetical protein